MQSAAPGCEPTCAEWIYLDGRISEAHVPAFKTFLSQLGDRKLPVIINSPGGHVGSAIAIGQMIRSKGLNVAVGKAVFAGCNPTEGPCPEPPAQRPYKGTLLQNGRALCASACPLVLAGGVSRTRLSSQAVIAVHRAYIGPSKQLLKTYRIVKRVENGLEFEVSRELLSSQNKMVDGQEAAEGDAVYKQMSAHFRAMGVGDSLASLYLRASYTNLYWLNRSEIEESRILTGPFETSGLIQAQAFAPFPKKPIAVSPSQSVSPQMQAANFITAQGLIYTILTGPTGSIRVEIYASQIEAEPRMHLEAEAYLNDIALPPHRVSIEILGQRLTNQWGPSKLKNHDSHMQRGTLPLADFCTIDTLRRLPVRLLLIHENSTSTAFSTQDKALFGADFIRPDCGVLSLNDRRQAEQRNKSVRTDLLLAP